MNNTRKLVQLALLSFVFIFNANGRGIRLEFGQRFHYLFGQNIHYYRNGNGSQSWIHS